MAPPRLARADAARTLLLAGIALSLLAILLGEVYAIFISHVANGAIKAAWAQVADAVIAGDAAALERHFAVIADLTEKRGRMMNTHSHTGAFGLLALLLGLLQPLIALAPAARRMLAWCFVAGAVLQAGGVYLSYYVEPLVLVLADIGAVLVVIALAGMLAGVLRGAGAGRDALAGALRAPLERWSGRLLLRAGMLLIVIGMSFGLYQASRLVGGDAQAYRRAMASAFEALQAADAGAAREHIAAFKRQQSINAITAAAHSHAVEFGILMVLLALMQSWVFLAEAWTRRWAVAMVLGAFALPVCVFLATKFGLRAAAFADISGALVMFGLAAMGVGVLRYTGAEDYRGRAS